MDAPRKQQTRAQPDAQSTDEHGDVPEDPVDVADVTLPTRATPLSGLETMSGHGRGGAPSSEPALLAAHTAVGRYIVLGHLGSGGMGVVYKAYDPDLDRQLALKLVRVAGTEGDASEHLRSRLLREAQGLAKLSHPNVVAIYDVGPFEDGVFLAMELVSGPTLRAWLKSEPSYRDKLRVFIAAGEGLEAAHRAHLVHRDFKPDNVILGADGRPKVLDFGLVRALRAGSEAPASALADDEVAHGEAPRDESEPSAEPGAARESLDELGGLDSSQGLASVSGTGLSSRDLSGEFDAPLTRVGSMLGTPRYMSPEQFAGLAVDAKSDQFSFCVALYQALYGKAPFRGKKLADMLANVRAGKVRPPPPEARVPALVRRAILKGLAADPAQRHASMEELLTELRRNPYARRRRIAIALGAVVFIGLGALAAAGRDGAAERCQVDDGATAALWSPSAERAIGQAFAATGRSHAADTATRVADILRERAEAWAAMRQESCEATWMRGSQSESLLDLRTQCLNERRAEQVSLLALLTRSELDPAAIDRAVEVASGLRAIATCADAKALRSRLVPPPPGMVAKVAELRERLAEVRVRTLTGDFETAVNAGEDLAVAARATDYPPLVGEVLYDLANALRGAARYPEAQTTFERAIETAATAGDDRTAALAAAQWLWVFGYALDQSSAALQSVAMARALAARAPDDAAVQLLLENAIATLLVATGDYAGAEKRLRHCYELAVRDRGGNNLRAARLKNNLGSVLLLQGKHQQAIAELTAARNLRRAVLGVNHPAVARTTFNLGLAYAEIDRHGDALEACRAALGILERAHGPEHLEVARALRCVAQSLSELGELSAAAEAAERSLALRERGLDPSHALVGESAHVLAGIYSTRGQRAEALELHRRAVAAFEPAHPDLVEALLGLGRGLVAVGRTREAVETVERAVAFADERELPTLPSAEAALADVLWRVGERDRARILARNALAALAAAGRQREHDELAAWLAARP